MKRASGFTLLEVMGAVVVLGLLGTSLMTMTIDSTRRTGIARDRLEASLIADSALSDVEVLSAAGALTAGRTEEPEGDWLVSVDVRALDAAALGLALLADRERDELAATILVPPPGAPAPLLRIDVRVVAGEEVLASRTSFAFDGKVAPELGLLSPSAGVADGTEPGA